MALISRTEDLSWSSHSHGLVQMGSETTTSNTKSGLQSRKIYKYGSHLESTSRFSQHFLKTTWILLHLHVLVLPALFNVVKHT